MIASLSVKSSLLAPKHLKFYNFEALTSRLSRATATNLEFFAHQVPNIAFGSNALGETHEAKGL